MATKRFKREGNKKFLKAAICKFRKNFEKYLVETIVGAVVLARDNRGGRWFSHSPFMQRDKNPQKQLEEKVDELRGEFAQPELKQVTDEARSKDDSVPAGEQLKIDGLGPFDGSTSHGEALLRTVLENSRDAINMLDLKTGRYVFMSPAQIELTGFTAEELRNLLVEDALARVHPDDRELSVTQQREAAAGRDPEGPVEYRLKVKSGEYRWFSDTRKAVRDERGEVVALVGVSRDITEQKRAEIAQRESEERLRAVFEALPAGVAIADLQGKMTHCNTALTRIWGGAPVPGSTGEYGEWKARWVDTGQPVKPEEWAMARAIRTGEVVPGDVIEIERFDGSGSATIINAAAPVRDAEGQIVGGVVAEVDITPQRRAEEQLRLSEERLRLALDAADMGSFMWYPEEDRNEPDARTLALFGLAPDSKLNLASALASLIHPADRERHAAGVAQALDPAGSGELRQELRVIHPNGAQRWVEVSARTVFGGDPPRALRMSGVVADVTDRKRAEEAGLASRRLLEAVVNHMPAAVCLIRGSDLRLQLVNPAYQAIAPGKEMLGKTLEELWPETGRAFSDLCRHVLETGEPHLVEHERNRIRRTPDGPIEDAYFSWSLHRIPQPGDSGWAILNAAWETTERKLAEEQLRAAKNELEQRVHERTAELSHTVELLQAEVARRESAEGALLRRSDQLRKLASQLTLAEQRERRHLADVLHDNLQQLLVGAKFRLAMLARKSDAGVKEAADEVQDLLDRSIECSRTLTSELSPPILHQSGLSAALKWLVAWMKEKHALEVDFPGEVEVEPRSEEIKVLLFNSARELLFNAIKHSRVTSATLRLESNGDDIELTVEDKGIGFTPDAVMPGSGSPGGFGLFSIRERLGLLGGRLEIDSEPGGGSRLVIVAPNQAPVALEGETELVPGDLAASSAIAGTDADSTDYASRTIRVMLVDDHALLRQGLSLVLRGEADINIVAEAPDGQTAVEMVRRLRPDVVLMDVSMPVMDGIEATRIIAAECPEVRVVGLSMFEEGEVSARMRKAGAVAFLTKSGPAEEVLATIRAHRRN